MSDDVDLARSLTSAVRATPGVTSVFPTRPLLHGAVEGIAATLDLPEPDVLVEVRVSAEVTTVVAHIGASSTRPAGETLRSVAARIRSDLARHAVERSVVSVKVRVVEDDEQSVGTAS